MGNDHHETWRHDAGRPDGGQPAEAGAQTDLEAAVERYRAAQERYAVAKYEYKAAKYALKAARLRAGEGHPGRNDARWKDRHGSHHGHRRGDHHGGHRYDRPVEQGPTGAPGPGPARRPDHGDHRDRRQVVMQVVETERIGEHVQRLTLGGDGFEDFRDNAFTDKYVKIIFVDPSLGLEPPYDVRQLRRTLPRHQLPVRRTYTVHSVDPEARTLAIDVVLHGEAGVAGPWASRAQVGDPVAFSGPGGKYAPDPGADWHLFVGDESALPAITAALAALPPDAVGTALLEVAGPADEQLLDHPDGVAVRWLHREPSVPGAGPGQPHPAPWAGGDPSPLVAAVEGMDWAPGRVHAFVHGEKSMVKRLRAHLLEARGVDKRLLSLSSYWTRGRDGD